MGLLDLHAAQAGVNEPPLQALPRTLGERVEATVGEVFAPDRYFTINAARRDMWQRAVDELHKATGEALPNPYGAVTPEEMMRLGNQPAVEADRRNAIIERARAARESFPDLFDPENIDRYIGEEADRRRQRAASYEGTGNGVLNFLAAAALETFTPHGIVGLVIPATRLPGAAASAVGQTFLRNVAREALFQGGANAALQAGAEGLDYLSRGETGTPQTAGEIALNIAGAATIGAAIGGGVRALHLKWLGLPEKIRADAPLEVKDAFRVIEAESLYGAHNRLGVDPLLHERYQNRAMDAVMRGRPVDLADLTRGADTPLTALGTILRQSPDQIRVEGLGTVLDRIRSLPDSEIEALGREMKPATFAPLDAVEGKLRDLEARAAAIREELNQIGIADVADIDTGARLQDIEGRLAQRNLRKAVRADLERERDMILESIDPRGDLKAELATLRKDFFPEQQRALQAIEEERAALMRERQAARSAADREIEAMRKRLDSLATGNRFADEVPAEVLAREFGGTPADLGPVISRADALRQARMVRESVGEPAAPAFRSASDIATSRAPKPVNPEQARALETETRRLLEKPANAEREVAIDGKVMSAAEAMEDADRMAKDAAAALNCAVGAL